MTLDEAIKHAEEVEEEQKKEAKEWHENQLRKCELIPFSEMDYTHENECKECAEEHRQLAEWLKELKRLKEQEPCEDWHDVPSDEMTLEQARQAVKDLRKKLAEYLWQEPCEDVMAIHTQGLDEGIRCAMCTNSTKSDRGCDGGCIVDDEMYKRVMNTINNHIFKQEPCEDCISRQAVKEQMIKYGFYAPNMTVTEFVEDLSSVTPQPKSGNQQKSEWVVSFHGFPPEPTTACKKCGFDRDFNINPRYFNKIKYCPNCGSKMMKEVKER